LAIMSEPIDFYGMHYYFPSRVSAGSPRVRAGHPDEASDAITDLPMRLEPWPEYPKTGFDWPVVPDMLTVLLQRMKDRSGPALPPILFTEGGASFPDEPAADGEVHDADRIEYLDGHLRAALAGVPGVEVGGYFVWTFTDNVEWVAGWTQRFGVVYVDRNSLER